MSHVIRGRVTKNISYLSNTSTPKPSNYSHHTRNYSISARKCGGTNRDRATLTGSNRKQWRLQPDSNIDKYRRDKKHQEKQGQKNRWISKSRRQDAVQTNHETWRVDRVFHNRSGRGLWNWWGIGNRCIGGIIEMMIKKHTTNDRLYSVCQHQQPIHNFMLSHQTGQNYINYSKKQIPTPPLPSTTI